VTGPVLGRVKLHGMERLRPGTRGLPLLGLEIESCRAEQEGISVLLTSSAHAKIVGIMAGILGQKVCMSASPCRMFFQFPFLI
jgi:hypothetical protein